MSVHFIALLHSRARYTFHACSDGTSAWQHTVACAQALKNAGIVSGCTLLCVGTGNDMPTNEAHGFFTHVRSIPNCASALIEQLCDLAGSETDLCLMNADAMISYDPLYVKIIDAHVKYMAHYTRGEGYPEAITPEILSPIACKILKNTLEECETNAQGERFSSPVERRTLFSLIEKRINEYDIEAVLAPKDMRMLRISLFADTRVNFTVAKQLWDSGLRNPDDIISLYHEKPQLFRSIPRYVYVQLTDAVQPTVYDPHYAVEKKTGAHVPDVQKRTECRSMHGDVWRAVMSKFSEYADDITIALGFGGEVALHPQVFSCIEEVNNRFSAIYVETNGYEWDMENSWWESIPKNVSWIVYLDTHSDQLYGQLRASEVCGLSPQEAKARAHAFVEMLLTKTKPYNVFVQATRMVENECELDEFCKYWEKKGARPIIQKYNDVCGMLPNKKTVDLAPLHRFACRHLERDMLIDIDGNVRMCFQDIHKKYIQGSVVEESLEALWKQNEHLFVQQAQGSYEKICRSCDEYYTCNT